MSKITKAFEREKAFIPFITCGYPNLDTTRNIIIEMSKNGADIIELGIPFSDPTAEGPVIQKSSLEALKAGTTTDAIFEMVQSLQGKIETPLVFMTYANVVFSYGAERFISKASNVGISGLILPDIPFEEKNDFIGILDKYDMELISMIAPTSKDRIKMIAKEARGFIYVVSSLGVTGVRSEIGTDIASIVSTIKENTAIPCAIGFGISTEKQASEMAEIADGVIVGSAIIKLIEEYGEQSPNKIGEYVKSMKAAMN